MHSLRLFNVVSELHCLPKCLHVCIIRARGCSPSFVTLYLMVFEIAKCICLRPSIVVLQYYLQLLLWCGNLCVYQSKS